MTDLKLYHTQDGAEINEVNGFAELDEGLGTAFYLSLVGGNEDGSEYWGNTIEDDPASRLYGRTYQLLQNIAATPANLVRVQKAVELDLAWFTDPITVSVYIPKRNYCGIIINTEVESIEYLLPWEAAK